MHNEPKTMREIHEIREKLYEEQRRLSTQELILRIHQEAEEAKKKYGLQFKKRLRAD